jgi:hypothetical protein
MWARLTTGKVAEVDKSLDSDHHLTRRVCPHAVSRTDRMKKVPLSEVDEVLSRYLWLPGIEKLYAQTEAARRSTIPREIAQHPFRVLGTTRGLMVAVAVVALLGWAVRMLSLSARYSERASQFERMFEYYWVHGPQAWPPEFPLPPNLHDRWAIEMARKYRRAALCPWFPVERDLSPPDQAGLLQDLRHGDEAIADFASE